VSLSSDREPVGRLGLGSTKSHEPAEHIQKLNYFVQAQLATAGARLAMERVWTDIAKPDPNPNPSTSPCPTYESIHGHE
jgi:hypothetical protein